MLSVSNMSSSVFYYKQKSLIIVVITTVKINNSQNYTLSSSGSSRWFSVCCQSQCDHGNRQNPVWSRNQIHHLNWWEPVQPWCNVINWWMDWCLCVHHYFTLNYCSMRYWSVFVPLSNVGHSLMAPGPWGSLGPSDGRSFHDKPNKSTNGEKRENRHVWHTRDFSSSRRWCGFRHAPSRCVNTGAASRLVIAHGTRLTCETSKFWNSSGLKSQMCPERQLYLIF